MFRCVLVANRGEVATRVARTARALGVSPVCVYSEADRGASWLEAFDEGVAIGPARATSSYLDQDAVLQAAIQTGCQALHPGWGFLAENALFAARVRQLGIAWVGPPARTIRAMGDKAWARRTIAAHGLATIPGSDGLVTSAEQARAVADELGYPVLLKATAGGGGRGMRIVADAAELERAFGEAASEAAAAFGDGGLYLEAFIASGRHIEFQVLADSWGHAVALGERECSVQRRHQKLIEEAPSPALDEATRARVGEQVAGAAAAIGYEGAGTIEFLREPGGALYFMEMNTRLQVEHPVTEAVSGVDLVEQQLRIAAGEPIDPALREPPPMRGHAIEVRVNAEDPDAGFKPTPGRITRFEIPTDLGPGTIRIDTHVRAGDEITPFYDSLVAKVIAWADDRDGAIETLARCLGRARIEGIATTIPACLRILESDEFRSGDYDTGIAERAGLAGSPS